MCIIFIRISGQNKEKIMKKILSIIIAVVFIVSMCAVAVSAQSYNPNGGCDLTATIKKADPANVIKDGIIGAGEYERYDVDLDPDSSSLFMAFGNNAAMYDNAEALLKTMEYYFSWDEVHGFNFAVKCRPAEFQQNIPAGEDNHGDEFLCNLGLQVELAQNLTRTMDDGPLFYYAISKNATTGEYIEGQYNQLGLKGAYDPVGGKDFEVSFGADGSVIYEWSVPFDNFISQTPADGVKFGFTLDALAGTDTPDEPYMNCYGVSLGGAGFMVDQRSGINQVAATLSDELIAGNSNPGDDSTNPGTNPSTDDPSTEPSTDKPVVDPKPDDPSKGNDNPSQGNDNPSQGNDNPSQGNKAPSTADPIVIAAIASAVSACGFAISKKRK